MIPCIKVTLAGVDYYPLYNNEAMLRLQDDYSAETMNTFTEKTKAGFELAFGFFRVLCEEGEAVRQHYGYPKGNIPEWSDARLEYSPNDVNSMVEAVYTAVSLGCTREVPDLEDTDLILQELEKKTDVNQSAQSS